MTTDRKRKAGIRSWKARTGARYMVARGAVDDSESPPASTMTERSPQVRVRPPLAVWNRPIECRYWAQLQVQHGPLIALNIRQGAGWWDLDDLAREVAGGLWLGAGRYTVTRREHLAGIVAKLDDAGALSRLTVRSVPDGANCTHASCNRRRGEPRMPAR
jgi:hypothetical protein